MKKTFTLLFSLVVAVSINSQTADFENFNLSPDEFLNGSDGNGGFKSGEFYFPNQFTDAGGYTYWSSWAVSSMTDTTTPGFANEFSCIAGGGSENSTSYAVSYVIGESIVRMPDPNDPLYFPYSVSINNSTYAYLSMLDGDGFAKKFGGLDGNDPDFFLLTIKGYEDGILKEDSIDFYLADYRFMDNSMDYIVDEWTTIDLMPLGHVDSLSFTLSSSDNNSFGMLTPAYFCLDNLILGVVEGTNDQLLSTDVKVFPNPAVHELSIDWKERMKAKAFIFSSHGQMMQEIPIVFGIQTVDISTLPGGYYFLKIQTEDGWVSRQFVKW